MRKRATGRETFNHARHSGWTRLIAAQIECAGFVTPVLTREQAVPIKCAEERPRCDRANVSSFSAQRLRCVPNFTEPAQLFFARATEMRFGHGNRQTVAVAGFAQQWRRSRDALETSTDGSDIGVTIAPVSAICLRRMIAQVLVEIPLARDVVIDPDDVRRAGVLIKELEIGLLGAERREITPHWMRAVDASAQKIPAQPAPLVFKIGLILQTGRCNGLAE